MNKELIKIIKATQNGIESAFCGEENEFCDLSIRDAVKLDLVMTGLLEKDWALVFGLWFRFDKHIIEFVDNQIVAYLDEIVRKALIENEKNKNQQ